jgi:hypothetical protein
MAPRMRALQDPELTHISLDQDGGFGVLHFICLPAAAANDADEFQFNPTAAQCRGGRVYFCKLYGDLEQSSASVGFWKFDCLCVDQYMHNCSGCDTCGLCLLAPVVCWR